MKNFKFSLIVLLLIFTSNLYGMELIDYENPTDEDCRINPEDSDSDTDFVIDHEEIGPSINDQSPLLFNMQGYDTYNYGISDKGLEEFGYYIKNYNPTIDSLINLPNNLEQDTDQKIQRIIKFIYSQAIKIFLNFQEINLIISFFDQSNIHNLILEKIYDQLIIFYSQNIKNNRYQFYVASSLSDFNQKYFNLLINKISKIENIFDNTEINMKTAEILIKECANKNTQIIPMNIPTINKIFDLIKIKAKRHRLDISEINTFLDFFKIQRVNTELLKQLYEKIVFLIYDKIHLCSPDAQRDYSEHYLEPFKHELLRLITYLKNSK
ncbi:hypothetical protein K9L05_01975 [Candidatus Babeliales bacterium]|nr:hypothetical protein [Candidatus Babeliales bacterium]